MPRDNDIREAFDPRALKLICEMEETDFVGLDGFDWYETGMPYPEDFYLHKDVGSDILYVAHLDTVVMDDERTASYVETHDGLVIHSGALDDRLGAYVGLELLPDLGLKFDVLLTVGEESGRSTAQHFTTEKEYNWMIEFDRGGTDVVMYDYEDNDTCRLVRAAGARVGNGSFSDIAYLEHLEIKGFNWGVGYHDYHTVRGYAYLEDTFDMVEKFMEFHEANADEYLPHEPPKRWKKTSTGYSWAGGKWHGGGDKGIREGAGGYTVDGSGVVEMIDDAYAFDSAHGDDASLMDEFAAANDYLKRQQSQLG